MFDGLLNFFDPASAFEHCRRLGHALRQYRLKKVATKLMSKEGDAFRWQSQIARHVTSPRQGSPAAAAGRSMTLQRRTRLNFRARGERTRYFSTAVQSLLLKCRAEAHASTEATFLSGINFFPACKYWRNRCGPDQMKANVLRSLQRQYATHSHSGGGPIRSSRLGTTLSLDHVCFLRPKFSVTGF